MANQPPEFITFTGVDQWTDPREMLALSQQYPIEWGILFSPKRQGVDPRYPPLAYIESIVSGHDLRFSAHLCGADARSVLEGLQCQHDELIQEHFDPVIDNLNRVQGIPVEEIADILIKEAVELIGERAIEMVAAEVAERRTP